MWRQVRASNVAWREFSVPCWRGANGAGTALLRPQVKNMQTQQEGEAAVQSQGLAQGPAGPAAGMPPAHSPAHTLGTAPPEVPSVSAPQQLPWASQGGAPSYQPPLLPS